MSKFISIFLVIILQFGFRAFAQPDSTSLEVLDPHDISSPKAGLGKWADCFDSASDNQPVRGIVEGNLLKDCQPDTLYSWGGKEKLKDFQTHAPKDGPWTDFFRKEVYSHINPAATFPYGAYEFRMKLKPGVKFFAHKESDSDPFNFDTCYQFLNREQQQNTVLVRFWKHEEVSGVDYILCSPALIESWSYDKKKNYDEVVNSLNWTEKHPGSLESLPWTRKKGNPSLFDQEMDGKDWSRTNYIQTMSNFRNRISRAEGEISYAPGASSDPNRHYSTDKPVYWNWPQDPKRSETPVPNERIPTH